MQQEPQDTSPAKHRDLKIFMLAGEASGDLHGKNLIAELKKAHSPGKAEFVGVGGDGMAAQGMRLIRHIRETNFMGFSEVLKNLGKIRSLFREVKEEILKQKPDCVILIDYPGFNLRLAKWLHAHQIRVFYFISPQVWAWKKNRIQSIRKYIERLYVILPFEKTFYDREGLEVDYFGHPLVDEIDSHTWNDEAFRKENKLGQKPLLALMPGSRKQEIERMLPVMLEAAKNFPDYQPVIAGASVLHPDIYFSAGKANIPVLYGQTYGLLHASTLAMVKSGTSTLEAALIGVPQVVCYSGNSLSVILARWLIQVKYISLVNLIAEREVVKELIQEDFNPERITSELKRIEPATADRERMLADYREIREKLGAGGAITRLAGAMYARILKGK